MATVTQQPHQHHRRPLQGVTNILRFNWHFYALATGVVIACIGAIWWVPVNWGVYAIGLAGLVLGSTLVSLLASAYVYDLSDLYRLNFTGGGAAGAKRVVNVNAGFDETSSILRERFPEAELVVLDFYDPARHTEVSIARARRAYPPYPGTRTVTTDALPLGTASVDRLFLTLAAHEIRDTEERVDFFRECRRVLAPGGRVYVTEHLRDVANFVVYNIGFLHFHSHRSWLAIFAAVGFIMVEERKTTPFVSTFILAADASATA